MLIGINLKLYSCLFTFVEYGHRANFGIVWKNPIFEVIFITTEKVGHRLLSQN